MSGYVRSVEIKIDWKQKHRKNGGGMVTRQPTPYEEHVLAETLAFLPAVNCLSFNWSSKPDAGAAAPLLASFSAVLAPRLHSLALQARVTEMLAFMNATNAALLSNIEQLAISIASPCTTYPVDELVILGKWIATAGSARLQSLRLTLPPNLAPRGQDPLTPCFVSMTSGHFGCLRTLELRFNLQGMLDEGKDTLLTFFRHVAPTLEALLLDIHCPTSDDLIQRQRWVEQWTAPLGALRKLELGWWDTRNAPVSDQDVDEYECLPQIRSSIVRLSDLTIRGLRVESIERQLACIAPSCFTLVRLQLTIDRLVPEAVTLLATSCPNLADLNLHFYLILGFGYENADSWECEHDLWKNILEVRQILTND